MSKPAIQLYTLRDMNGSLPEIIERVADAGFKGVEFAYRFENVDPDTVAATLEETEVEPIGAHIALKDLERDLDTYVNRYEKIDCRSFVIPHLPISHFRTEQHVLDLADRLNAVGKALDDRGFELLYHNQDHDFLPLSGRTPFSRFLVHDISQNPLTSSNLERRIRRVADRFTSVGGMLDDHAFIKIEQHRDRPPVPIIGGTAFGRLVTATDSEYVSFEVDVGGIVAAGYDPIAVLDRLKGRVPQVHLKDVAVDRAIPGAGQTSVEPGNGDVDFTAAAAAAQEAGASWLIYEHDDPDDPAATLQNGANAVIPLVTE